MSGINVVWCHRLPRPPAFAKSIENWIFLWDDYTWAHSDVLGMEDEVEGSDVSAASTGVGAAINCRISMVNIEGSWNRIDNAGLHRSQNPGAGAITPYHDRQSIAIDDISAGQELFISYGESYFESRVSTYGLLPLLDDFERADALLETYRRILPQTTTSLSLRQGLLDFIVNFPFKNRTINAMPTNASVVEYVAKVGTGKQYESTRSLEWLEMNGKCMDNIKPDKSTIPEAGRGAFVTRFIPKGGVVAPAPLLHITNKTRVTMYDIGETVNGSLERNSSKPVHEQLLVNYCFGHSNSSLLLSSYGMITGLINHSSKKPNVRIEWSDVTTHDDWCELSLKELSQKTHAGLVFDYVALRDIYEGEEILLDYGKDWEDAWNKHIRHWKPPAHSEKYMPAYEYENNPDTIIRTIHEEPYSDNVILYLYDEYRLMSGLPNSTERDRDWHRPRVLDRFQDVNNNTVYMVEIFHEIEDYSRDMTWVKYDKDVLFVVPRDAFSFRDIPYSRDHHLHTSFRHPMMVPDDMMPDQWKNL